MPDLPSGTVTFLFTDIEGSTRIWENHPKAMRSALARHDALMRSAIESHNGHVFKTVGDAFCAAFYTALDALEAALAAQQALQQVSWQEIGNLRVRMALHTGVAEERESDYFGPPLNRVARLLSIGHGEQVLLSLPAEELVKESLPKGCALKDMGSHRLKDLQQSEHVFQLVALNLPAEFPPLRSLQAFGHNLPIQLTSFIGREKQIEEVWSLLAGTRLLTLTGAGGCGKTRLALQVAADHVEVYPDGVWLVELAALSDSSLVAQTVASALRVREEPGRSLVQTLCDTLAPRCLLLLLDNAEHLLPACANLVQALLKSCPQLTLLVTSREAMNIAGEQIYRVPSLSMPDPTGKPTPQSLGPYESVRLFIERALLVKSDFAVTHQNAPALAQVCHRLDGIPLGIELAAARVRSLAVEEINVRLDHRFRLLTGGSKTALPRQQTLRALIDWSYDLLNAQERQLLARLSVFAGGWTLAAAESICAFTPHPTTGQAPVPSNRRRAPHSPSPSGGEGESQEWNAPLSPGGRGAGGEGELEVLDLLTGLADKSLVIAETQGAATRYRFLETVRQYAHDRLAESDEGLAVQTQHRDYFLTLAEEIRPKLTGSEQALWFAVLEEEHDNLRQALRFCQEEPMGAEAGLRLSIALGPFWMVRGHYSEARERLEAALAHPGEQEHTKERSDALNGAGVFAQIQRDYPAAHALHGESLVLRRKLGDKEGVATSLNNLGLAIQEQGDYAAARILYEECLAAYQELGNKRGIALALGNLGSVAHEQGDAAAACALQAESLAIRRELGDQGGIAVSLASLGKVAREQGDYAAARTLQAESLAISREIGDRGLIVQGLQAFAFLAQQEQQAQRAVQLWGAAAALREAMGSPLPPNECEEYERGLASVREALGEEVFWAAWEQGRAITLKQAIAYALEEGQQESPGHNADQVFTMHD